MYSYSKFEHNSQTYYKYKEPISSDYRVFLNGIEIPVYTCRISAYPFNRVWPGFQRPVEQTEIASYVNIVSDEEIELEVQTSLKYDRILIKPYSKNIKYTDENGKIRFKLKENGQFVLECGSYHHCLYIFNSLPIESPKKDVTYYFEPGIHFPGKITLKSNESVYIDKDALVYGCIYAENVENIHIFGNGIFDDSHEERTGNYCYENYINGNMKFYKCNNLNIEGIGMKNSAIWCLNLFACTNVEVDGIKIFGQWRYNTDGIDIVNSENIFIKNSFVHSFDDTVTIKGIEEYCRYDNKNIHIDGCVLWCDWGRCCEIGVETLCREYKNISFRNCDILRGGCKAMAVEDGDYAEISDILFENINVEYNNFDTQEQYQYTDDEEYVNGDKLGIPSLFEVISIEWRSEETRKVWGLPEIDPVDMSGLTPNLIHDVKCKNINVYYDDGLPWKDGKPIFPVVVGSDAYDVKFYNIEISDVKINGKKVSRDEIFVIENGGQKIDF